jgi:ferredoxin
MPKVTFKDDDIDVDVDDGANLRDVAMEEGSSIPFGCEQGICGTCLSNIPSGEENLSPAEEQEEETVAAMGGEPGQRLICQCQVHGDVEIEGAH